VSATAKAVDNHSIFAEVNDKIDKILRLTKGSPPKFGHKAASDQLTKQGNMKVGVELVREIYDQIELNWAKSKKPRPAEELWVPRRLPEWSVEWRSAEVPLERSAVALFKFYDVLRERLDDKPNPDLTWFNQIPVASGIVSQREGRNAIDLVCRTARGAYDFVELKFPKRSGSSETPLNAAVEILKNGVLYLFTRRHLADLERQGYRPQLGKDQKLSGIDAREILEANRVTLCVLAPRYFYDAYDLAWLEDELNQGLKDHLTQPIDGLEMRFCFEYLPDKPFEISPKDGFGFKLDFTRCHLDQWDRAASRR
jgi:hypothetical protein